MYKESDVGQPTSAKIIGNCMSWKEMIANSQNNNEKSC